MPSGNEASGREVKAEVSEFLQKLDRLQDEECICHVPGLGGVWTAGALKRGLEMDALVVVPAGLFHSQNRQRVERWYEWQRLNEAGKVTPERMATLRKQLQSLQGKLAGRRDPWFDLGPR